MRPDLGLDDDECSWPYPVDDAPNEKREVERTVEYGRDVLEFILSNATSGHGDHRHHEARIRKSALERGKERRDRDHFSHGDRVEPNRRLVRSFDLGNADALDETAPIARLTETPIQEVR
jgi:hypothetical protein